MARPKSLGLKNSENGLAEFRRSFNHLLRARLRAKLLKENFVGRDVARFVERASRNLGSTQSSSYHRMHILKCAPLKLRLPSWSNRRR